MLHIDNLEAGVSVRGKINQAFDDVAALQAAAALSFDTVAALLADSTLTYDAAPAGTIVEAGGFRYAVAATTATDQHVTTAGGVKLYVQPSASGKVTPQQFGAVGDGTADDRPAFVALNTYGGDAYLPKPAVAYNVATAINLDRPAITVDPTASWEALTDTGLITWNTNPFTQQNPPVPVHRFNGRAFFGDAAHEMAGGWAGSTTDDRGPLAWYAKDTPIFGGYTHRDATVAVANGKGTTALALSTRSSQQWNSAWDAPIGLGIFVWNDGNGEAWSSTWGGIIEGRASQVQGNTFGLEVALGNISGVSKKITPYNWRTGEAGGVNGFWMAGGGDPSSGSPSNAPNNSPLVILKNYQNTTLDGGWTTGIVFGDDALTGTDGSATSTSFASAISMARMQRIEWLEPTNLGRGFSITSTVQAAAGAWRMEADNSRLYMKRQADGGRFAEMRDDGLGGVDYPVLQNGTGTASYRAEGASTDINLFLSPKGTGRVRFGTHTASSDVPVTGYIEILDSGGNVRRLAVVG